jgi:integral membrane protein
MTRAADPERLRLIRKLRIASLLEATTLVLLIFVAVPAKHLFGEPHATAIMGPIHGLAFVFYIWLVLQAAGSGDWPRATIGRMVLFAFIPLAGFINERMLWQEEKRFSI